MLGCGLVAVLGENEGAAGQHAGTADHVIDRREDALQRADGALRAPQEGRELCGLCTALGGVEHVVDIVLRAAHGIACFLDGCWIIVRKALGHIGENRGRNTQDLRDFRAPRPQGRGRNQHDHREANDRADDGVNGTGKAAHFFRWKNGGDKDGGDDDLIAHHLRARDEGADHQRQTDDDGHVDGAGPEGVDKQRAHQHAHDAADGHVDGALEAVTAR